MADKPTILFLGASADQSSSYQAAQKLGFHLIGIDGNPDAYAFRMADETYTVSVRDYKKIQSLLKGRKIDAIYSQASDAARLSEYHLAKAFNTPKRVSMESVHASMDKSYFLRTLKQLGLPSHKQISSQSPEELKEKIKHWRYPFVVKPNDSSGSKGLTVVYREAELDNALCDARSVSVTNTIVCEELVNGTHYSIDPFVHQHRVEFMAVSGKLMTEHPLMIPMHYIMPIAIPTSLEQAMKEHVERICVGLDIQAGPITCDVVVTDDNQIHFIEMGARAGGNGISLMVDHAYGVDYASAAIRLHAGWSASASPQYSRHVSLMAIASPVGGCFRSIEGLDELIDDAVVESQVLFCQPGEVINQLESSADKIGFIIVKGESVAQLYERIDRVKQELKISIEADNIVSTHQIV